MPKVVVVATEGGPTPQKLEAWAKVRAIWVAMGKNPGVTQTLLDAEYKAENTD